MFKTIRTAAFQKVLSGRTRRGNRESKANSEATVVTGGEEQPQQPLPALAGVPSLSPVLSRSWSWTG